MMGIMRPSSAHGRSVPVNFLIIYLLPIPVAAGSSNLERVYKLDQVKKKKKNLDGI